MATAKTVKKTTAPSKKITTKPTQKAKKVAPKSASRKTQNVQSISLLDLQKKVMDPKNRRSLYLAIAVIVLALVIYFGKSIFVAAVVNGQPVSRLSIIRDLEAQSGKAALDAIITRTLVFQEANKQHITISSKDIDNEVAKIQKQFQSQGQNLDQLLATQGLTKDKFRDEVKVQLIVTKILGDKVKVSDKEFEDFLSKNQDLIANEKDQEAAKVMLRQQMTQQKLAQKYQEWIAQVKKNAKIYHLVDY